MSEIVDLLETYVDKYNQKKFIENDPISVPHTFSRLQDVEISGFFSSILAWGLRKTIIKKSMELMSLMDHAPYDFILNHKDNDLKKNLAFKHRTFNATDTLYFITFFKWYYTNYNSLEDAFINDLTINDKTLESGLIHFKKLFFSLPDYPIRTKKHISSPENNATCKRINMFLRWMVRKDNKGVDFGLWNRLKPSQLFCPCDVHVEKTARNIGLITRKQRDWKMVLELTQNLRDFDSEDPAKYDFALFGMGLENKLG